MAKRRGGQGGSRRNQTARYQTVSSKAQRQQLQALGYSSNQPVLLGYQSPGAARRAQLARNARRVHGTVRAGIRHRRRLAALYSTMAVAAAGEALHLAGGGAVLAVGLGAAPAVVAAARLARRVRKHRALGLPAPRLTGWQWAGWSVRAGLAVWLPLAAASGYSAPVREMLAGGALAGMTGWGLYLRRNPIELEPEGEQQDEELDITSVEGIWSTYVANREGVLPGSVLTELTEDDNGWNAVVQLVRGRQTLAQAQMGTDRIASAYGRGIADVSLVPLRGGLQHQVSIAVYNESPLQEVQLFEGPSLDLATGWFTLANLVNGGKALWRLFEPGSGPCSGLLFGGQGTGKSSALNTILIEITQCGIAALWLGDGQDGLSTPDWVEEGSDWFAGGPYEVLRMLRAAVQVMKGRKRRRRNRVYTDSKGRVRRGQPSFDGTAEEPYLFIVIDEWSVVAKDPDVGEECVALAMLLVQAGRKLGIAVIGVVQIPSGDEVGGKSPKGASLRNLLALINVAMFRTSKADKTSQHMGGMGITGIDPDQIPEAWPDGSTTAGLGYLRSFDGIVASMRALLPDDPYGWALSAAGTTLEAAAIIDAGEDYATWRQRREALIESGLDEEEFEEPGEEGDEDETSPAAAGGTVLIMPGTSSGSVIRAMAVQILGVAGQVMSSKAILGQIKTLTGDTKLALNAVTKALTRAAEAGEVVQMPGAATGEDRSARWIAAAFAPQDQAEEKETAGV
jgi:hypothetical protein